jgi:hypothetical protein
MGKSFKNVYQFKISLKGTRPPIWRRIQVPDYYTFWGLHTAIQNAMGWLDLHLHAFRIINPKKRIEEEIGIPDDEFDGPEHKVLAGWKQKISRYFSVKNNKALYIYDFGDYWEHDLKLEKILLRDTQKNYPICVAGRRACPPEDCGGLPGYEDLLEVLSNPEHEEYETMLEWVGGEFDPEHFEVNEVYFSDPKAHWDYHFDPEDDEDEDLLAGAGDDVTRVMRILHREHMHDIWEKAKAGELEDLDAEEKHLAKIILDHKDEFINEFKFADMKADHEYDPETETNAFLHVSIHSVVENQLESKYPIEAFQFYNAMRKNKCSHHDTLHLIGLILIPFMLHTLQDNIPFDLDSYMKLLKKYKTRKPDRIPELLESEPLFPL